MLSERRNFAGHRAASNIESNRVIILNSIEDDLLALLACFTFHGAAADGK